LEPNIQNSKYFSGYPLASTILLIARRRPAVRERLEKEELCLSPRGGHGYEVLATSFS